MVTWIYLGVSSFLLAPTPPSQPKGPAKSGASVLLSWIQMPWPRCNRNYLQQISFPSASSLVYLPLAGSPTLVIIFHKPVCHGEKHLYKLAPCWMRLSQHWQRKSEVTMNHGVMPRVQTRRKHSHLGLKILPFEKEIFKLRACTPWSWRTVQSVDCEDSSPTAWNGMKFPSSPSRITLKFLKSCTA